MSTAVELRAYRTDRGSVELTASAKLEDGSTVGPHRVELDGSGLQALQSASSQLRQLCSVRGRPYGLPDPVGRLGRAVFDAALKDLWAQAQPDGGTLTVHCEGDLLAWPWELMTPPPGQGQDARDIAPIGCDPNWRVIVSPLKELVDGPPLSGGPLRVLVLVASPEETRQAGRDSELDYEYEEERILAGLAPLGEHQVAVCTSDLGTLEELGRLARRFRPHVVHLSGHGTLQGGKGVFVFEDERGQPHAVTGVEIYRQAFAGVEGLRCVFVNACLTAKAADEAEQAKAKGQEPEQTAARVASGLCESLIAAGVPLAIGWGDKVIDTHATTFAGELYTKLAEGTGLGSAMAWAREKLRETREENVPSDRSGQIDLTYTMPRLFGRVNRAERVLDLEKTEQVDLRPAAQKDLGHGVMGLSEGFVGRRRDLQKLLPALVGTAGPVKTIAVLTGLGGLGKSTMATKAVLRLEEKGYERVVVGPVGATGAMSGLRRAEQRKSLKDKQLAESVKHDLIAALRFKAVEWAQQHEAAAKMAALLDERNTALSLDDKLAQVPAYLAKLPWVVLLDNFEDALAGVTDKDNKEGALAQGGEARPAVADTALSHFITACTTMLTNAGGARLLITCRYLPKEIDPEASPVLSVPLRDLTPAGLRKLLMRDEAVRARFMNRELPMPLIGRLHRVFGGTPRFVKEVLWKVLKDIDAADLESSIEEMDRGEEPSDADLAKQRRGYLQEIAAPYLIGKLSEQARRAAQAVALAHEPVPAEAVGQMLAGLGIEADEEQAARWMTEAEHWGLTQPVMTRIPVSEAALKEATELLSLPDDPAAAAKVIAKNLPPGVPESALLPMAEKLLEQKPKARRMLADAAREPRRRYQAPGLLRGELLDGLDGALEPLDTQTRRTLHGILATWWKGVFDDDREPEMGVVIAVGLDAVRVHAIDGGLWDLACLTTAGLANQRIQRAEYREASELLHAVPEEHRDGRVLSAIATIDEHQGQYQRAREGFEKALKLLREVGNRRGEAATLHQIASIDVHEGEHTRAREGFEASLAIEREIDNRKGEAATLHQIATIDIRQGQYTRAREGFTKALKLLREIGNRYGEAATLHQIASIDVHEGEYTRAREGFEKTLMIRREIGDRQGEAKTLHQIASIDVHEGEYTRAREGLEASLMIKREIGDRQGEAATFSQLSYIMYELKRFEHAARLQAVCYLIDKMIGHGDEQGDWENLTAVAGAAGMDQAGFDAMLKQVVEAYKLDRGDGLIREAFEGIDLATPAAGAAAEPADAEDDDTLALSDEVRVMPTSKPKPAAGSGSDPEQHEGPA